MPDAGKFFIPDYSWMCMADFVVPPGGTKPYQDVRRTFFDTLMAFFRSDKNDYGATFEIVAICTDDWNTFAQADNKANEKREVFSDAAFDEM